MRPFVRPQPKHDTVLLSKHVLLAWLQRDARHIATALSQSCCSRDHPLVELRERRFGEMLLEASC